VIVTVCADKGSPGVTTLATALAMAWPGERLVLEADPSGGDLAFRARQPGGGLLAGDPSVLTLAADARTGLPDGVFARYAQATTWGVPVIQGAPGAAGFAPARNLWPAVAAEAARWPGTVIADLGRLQPGNAALPVAKASTAVLVLARVSVESLFHLRERIGDLAAAVGDPSRARNPVAVVVSARRKDSAGAVRQVTRMLEAVGSPIPVAGVFAEDAAAARELAAGEMTRRLTGSDLLRSAGELATVVRAWWPHLAGSGPSGGPSGWEPSIAPEVAR
jgi:hypothetical protein